MGDNSLKKKILLLFIVLILFVSIFNNIGTSSAAKKEYLINHGTSYSGYYAKMSWKTYYNHKTLRVKIKYYFKERGKWQYNGYSDTFYLKKVSKNKIRITKDGFSWYAKTRLNVRGYYFKVFKRIHLKKYMRDVDI